ncbi:GntR family transcriptional regulator [Nocardioides sp. NPDC092400]|uniref:GntR family transcriptional regulator n=1 Tax=Nocardioides sp. NPDC092400 TaxID=3155196 RepID=UPI003438E88E
MSTLNSERAISALFVGDTKPALASTGERVADALRALLIEGRIAPATRMSEEAFASAMGVSRNTLREAFRLLAHENLLVHELNRGVFVRQLTAADIHSIYQVREMIELAAVRSKATHTAAGISRLRLAVTQGLAAAEVEDWSGVGTANMNFHTAIAALAANERIDAMMRRTLAEQRLAFHVMHPIRDFHEPYLPDNERICRLLEDRELEEAQAELAAYLERAEQQLVDAYRALEN